MIPRAMSDRLSVLMYIEIMYVIHWSSQCTAPVLSYSFQMAVICHIHLIEQFQTSWDTTTDNTTILELDIASLAAHVCSTHLH